MYTLTTLDRLRAHVGLSATDTGDDARLLAALESVTAEIERLTGRHFCPQVASRSQTIHLNDTTELLLNDDLLALTALTNGDGTAIDTDSALLLPGGDGPSSVLRLLDGEAFVYDETPLNAVTVAGIWGWHDRWSQAWLDSGDTVQDNPLAATASTLTVTDADASTAGSEIPRFQVGQLLSIEEEYLWVLAVDAATNTLTVERGANGTTAVAHTQGTTIHVYRPPHDVVMLCLRWATWVYREPDGFDMVPVPPALLDLARILRRVSVQG